MSNTVAAVKFEGTEKSYFYACEIQGLERGDILNVEGADKSVTFIGYVESDLIGFAPTRKVTQKAPVIATRNYSGVRTGGRTVRSKQQREADAKQLRTLLQESHPTMLSMRDIAESMSWETDGASNLIKNAMSLEPKIVQVYKGWYTSKL